LKLDRSWNAVEFLFVALFCLSVRAQQPSRRSPEKILELNRWLKAFCAANSHVYLDYFSTMADTKGLLKRDLADDGPPPESCRLQVDGAAGPGSNRKSAAAVCQALVVSSIADLHL